MFSLSGIFVFLAINRYGTLHLKIQALKYMYFAL